MPRAGALVLTVLGFAGCASAPLPPGARAVYAFDVETYLGRRYAVFGATRTICSARRASEQAAGASRAPERSPFFRTTVLTGCFEAALADGGWNWAAESDGDWGAVMPSEQLCEAMRETMLRSGARSATPCARVTLTRR